MKIKAHWQIIIALVVATLLGVAFRSFANGSDAVDQIMGVSSFVGGLFMQALKMIIVPLVVSSVIAGIAGLGGMEGFGRLGLKTLGFYFVSTLLAVVVGLAMVNLIQPGMEDGACRCR